MRNVFVHAGLAGLLALVTMSSAGAAPARKPAASVRPAPVIVPLDPAGTYSGYPEWARRALGPKAGGGGGR